MRNVLSIRNLGRAEYIPVWEAMKSFTDSRDDKIPDEVWFVEHPPVYTQGQAGKPEHVLNPGDIPVIQTDRGGQVTYHGPGQLVAYILFNLKRLDIGVRKLVMNLEQAIIAVLADYKLTAKGRRDAPGVYVDEAKICSIGLRVRKGLSYHGLAFNIHNDLEPFSRINPCGFRNLTITKLSDFVPEIKMSEVQTKLADSIAKEFGYLAILNKKNNEKETTS